jgi:hypothetical protein
MSLEGHDRNHHSGHKSADNLQAIINQSVMTGPLPIQGGYILLNKGLEARDNRKRLSGDCHEFIQKSTQILPDLQNVIQGLSWEGKKFVI